MLRSFVKTDVRLERTRESEASGRKSSRPALPADDTFMLESVWPYFGDIHKVLPSHWAGVVVALSAVFCGGLIGIERQRARKPAGMRTLILICLGAAIFTQASILLADGWVGADRTRVAAQIVTGIGFLGAGAIIHERGLLIGVTTGAGIWATAAVGAIIGSGHVAAGFFFTILIFVVLALSKSLDRIALGPCRYKTLQIDFDPDGGRTRLSIQIMLEEFLQEGKVHFEEGEGAQGRATLKYCDAHPDHHPFLPELLAHKAVTRFTHC